jgi:hypothetical protein
LGSSALHFAGLAIGALSVTSPIPAAAFIVVTVRPRASVRVPRTVKLPGAPATSIRAFSVASRYAASRSVVMVASRSRVCPTR